MVYFFSAGMPAYARIKAGATALKSNSDSYNFSAEKQSPKCTALLHCNFGGNPPAGKGRAEDTKKNVHLQTFPQKNVRARAFC